MGHENLPAKIQALLEPTAYGHAAEDIQLVQTHISYVFLAGDFVYKFKKPVDFGFLDFSTLEKRQECCEQELILNRRLCPEIYLDLVRLTSQDDGFTLNGTGEVVEYGIMMKRMPEEKMMSNLVKDGKVDKSHIDALVEALVPFYQKAERSSEIDQFGTAKGVAVNVLENFEQTETFVGSSSLSAEQYDRIVSYSKDFLKQENCFEDRIRQGYIRDCHGDLYSANICLAEKVYIYDCIEFNQRFRYCDVASDIAFLAMDLDLHGLEDLSDYLVDKFQKLSGDQHLGDMLSFYKCYRAYVRGKIGMFTASDPAVDSEVRQSCQEAAAKYFALADKYTVIAGS